MKCPACDNDLQKMTVDDLTVDVCQGGCGGVWFDAFELEKVDEAHEARGQALLDVKRDARLEVDHTRKRMCPRCEGMVMRRYFFSPNRQIEIDECPKCAGFWLDDGELMNIRTRFPTESDRERAAQEHFEKLFGPQLEQMAAERNEKLARARSIAQMFRFICPSNYIPGKQAWGAF